VAAGKDVNAEQAAAGTRRALWDGLKGGLAGVAVGVLQVFCLMWIRTVMNWQYYHGGNFANTVQNLWADGGLPRFYQGIGIALIQVPLARFGDTFVETTVIAIFGVPGKHVHGYFAGLIVASVGACWRLFVAPLDTLKINAQVHGSSAGKILTRRLRVSGLLELWSGASALFLVNWLASFPWWTVYNTVLEFWPEPVVPGMRIVRNGVAGIMASMISDMISNSLRILKVMRQATVEGSIGAEGYLSDAREVMTKDGVAGIFCRGIGPRLLAGALQGAFFSILWNLFLGRMVAPHPHAS